jgi:hypothetical protein
MISVNMVQRASLKLEKLVKWIAWQLCMLEFLIRGHVDIRGLILFVSFFLWLVENKCAANSMVLRKRE